MFGKLKYKVWRHLNKKYGQKDKDNLGALLKEKIYSPPQKTCKTIVAITGFGHSGSGALEDLLSEYKDVTVYADAEPNGSLRKPNFKNGTNELNIFRHSGGLFFLEKFFPSRNIFVQDCIVKMFLALVKEHYVHNGEIYNNKFLELTNEFLNSILELKLKTNYGIAYQPHLPAIAKQTIDFLNLSESENQYLFTLKNISKEEYLNSAKKYMQNFFETINSEKYLVLDQILSDNECGVEHYKRYIDNLKLIAVYRDPRDVYATAIELNIGWIPHNVDEFIIWYRNSVKPYFENQNKDYLLIRFEDIIFHKHVIQEKIETFLNFEPNSHIAPRTAFDESVSLKNIGLYKRLNMSEEIDKIETELSEFLYRNEDYTTENQPLVSICCLSYNHAKFIPEAIKSFWNQEYKNIEIIALDDGSTDNSGDVLQELAKESPCPMTVLTQENTGNVPKNFNTLLKKAKGKYIGIIALDDYLYNTAISEKIRLMEKDENVIFVANSCITSLVGGKTQLTKCYLDGIKQPSPDDILEAEYNHVNPYYCQGTFYRHDVVKKLDYFDENMIIDDDVLICKTALYLKENPTKTFIILSNPACYYRVLNNSYSKNYILSVRMFQNILDKYFPDRKPSKKYKERIKMVIKQINYSDFKSYKYFKNENKPFFYNFIFYCYYRFIKK